MGKVKNELKGQLKVLREKYKSETNYEKRRELKRKSTLISNKIYLMNRTERMDSK